MIDTSFTVPDEKIGRFANCWYSNWAGGHIDITELQRQSGDYVADKARFHTGGGGLVSTMRDYFSFSQCMLNGGVAPSGARILSRSTVDWMVKNHLQDGSDMFSLSLPGYTENSAPGMGFGLGFGISLDNVKSGQNVSSGTFSWGGLAGTRFHCDPVEEITVIFMTQCIGINPVMTPVQLLLANVVAGSIIDGTVGQPAQRSLL